MQVSSDVIDQKNMKRWKKPKAKPGQLKVCYGKLKWDSPDICYVWGDGISRADSSLLHHVFSSPRYIPGSFKSSPSLYDELEKRGYDLTTLKFTIQKKSITNKSSGLKPLDTFLKCNIYSGFIRLLLTLATKKLRKRCAQIALANVYCGI